MQNHVPDSATSKSTLVSRDRWREFEAKRAALADEKPVTFTHREYVQHVLLANGLAPKQVAQALGVSPNYFNHTFNDGQALPTSLVTALSILSGEGETFWQKSTYTMPEAGVPTLDMARISQLPEGLFKPARANRDAAYVPIIASERVREAIRKLPKYAQELLYDPATKDWKPDTFLVDAEGRFRPEWRDFSEIARNKFVAPMLKDWCQLPAHGEHLELKRRFLTTLITAAAEKGLPPSTDLLEFVAFAPATQTQR